MPISGSCRLTSSGCTPTVLCSQDSFDDMDSARVAVLRGHAWGVLSFRANFSRHMTQRQLLMQDASVEDFVGSEADAYLDMSSKARESGWRA